MEKQVIATPLGGIEIWTERGRLKELHLTNRWPRTDAPKDPIAWEIQRYFHREPVSLRDIPLDLSESTKFERKVYQATRKIPFGKVATYGQIAKAIGKPKASRAVGQALGKNPIAIVIPCHRIVASDGGLGGFTGGLRWKRKLLRHEGTLK
jgi:methylated-DNA-[protein]-cysteine S-methyltransferase